MIGEDVRNTLGWREHRRRSVNGALFDASGVGVWGARPRRDGVVKLADFGASKVYREGTVTDGMKSLKGSLFWMAPEVRARA